jgi:hypothetical protein
MTVTVLELLREKLPEKYVLAIIANMQEKSILDEEAEGSLLDEMESIFDWQESNEGWVFWVEVFEAISEGEELPELPLNIKWKPNTYLCLSTGSYLVNFNDMGRDATLPHDVARKSREPIKEFIREQHFAFCN